MINFIVGEDTDSYRLTIERIISEYMMKNDLEYSLHVFKDYNKEFLSIIDEKLSFKVYILDIETPSGSGIDMARRIRKKDVNSIIIFLTGHQELSEIILKDEFGFLSFINKFDDYEKRLKVALGKSCRILKAQKVLKFKDKSTIYTISLSDVLYITTDTTIRKSIIKTDYGEFQIGKSLCELKDMVTGNFIQTHRSCIVNQNRVISFDKKTKIITFDTGDITNMVSSRFEENLI